MELDTAGPVHKAATRIRQASRNAFYVPLDPLNRRLAIRVVICVQSAHMLLKLGNLVVLVSHAPKAITQILEGNPAAKLVLRGHIKP